MTNYEILNIVNTISGEKLKDVKLTPERFELMLKVANLKHFKEKVGIPEQYQPGMPVLRQGYEITRINSMDLAPFKVWMGKYGAMPLKVDSYSNADFPSDLYYPGTMQYEYIVGGVSKKRDVDIVSDMDWNERHIDSLTYPTQRNPIANIQNDFIRFSPIKNADVFFVYIKQPADPVFAFTQAKGYVEYDSANSTDLEWNYTNQIDVIYKLLFDLGVNISKPEILEVASKVKEEGV